MLQESCIHPTFHTPGWDVAPSFTHVMIPIPEHHWYFPNCQLSQKSWLGGVFGKWPSVKKSQHFHLCKLDACNFFFIICKHFLFWVTMVEMATLSFKINQNGANNFWAPPSPRISPPLPPSPQPLVNYGVKEFIPHLNIHAVCTQSQASAEVYKGSISQNLIHYIYRWRLGQQCSFPQHRWWWWSR